MSKPSPRARRKPEQFGPAVHTFKRPEDCTPADLARCARVLRRLIDGEFSQPAATPAPESEAA